MRTAAWPDDTFWSRVARRLALVLFERSRCRKPGVRRKSKPVEVILNRLATEWLVFCMAAFDRIFSVRAFNIHCRRKPFQ